MNATYSQEDDVVEIKADKAKLDKENMNVHLEDNVEVESKRGVTLNARSLDWDQNSNIVSTDTEIQVDKKQSLSVKAQGLKANTELSKVDFQKDVEMNLFSKSGVIKVNCDGPLEIDYESGKAIFHNNVVVNNAQGKMIAKKAIVYFESQANRIVKIVAKGDVKVIRDDNVTFAEQATYSEKDKKIILEGRPRLIIFPDTNSRIAKK